MAVNITPEQLQNIMQAALTAVNAGANNEVRPRVKSPDRPDIDLGFSETQWAFFEDEWALYKRRASLKPDQVTDELRACCSKDLRKTLFDFVGSTTLSALTEPELLEKIKDTAVIAKNKAVHRKEFYEIKQSPDEPVNRYVAKLKAKAERCNFTMTCSAVNCVQVNNYGEEMIKDQMTTGLYDKDIQQEVLAKDKELATFKETYSLVEAYELGKRAKSQLESQDSEVNAMKSQYKSLQMNKNGTDQKLPKFPKLPGCPGCGGNKHSAQQREQKCPAWGRRCYHCGTMNHFSHACNQKQKKEQNGQRSNDQNWRRNNSSEPTSLTAIWSEPVDNGDDVSYFLSFSGEIQNLIRDNQVSAMPHIEWDGNKFNKTKPLPLPSLEVKVTPLLEYHEHFLGTKIPVTPNNVVVHAFTDTCAQTCVGGESLLNRINVSHEMLVPTSHRIVGVTKRNLDIIGILLAKVECHESSTNTVIYICKDVNGLFLSAKVQMDLGVVPVDYPNASSVCVQSADKFHKSEPSSSYAECGCFRREKAPPKPEKMPFEPVEENRKKIEEWILSTYTASAFNTCEHQPTPKMSGTPFDVHYKEGEEGKPVAVHCPIPVPHNWKQQVEDDLARDVRLEVIEPVPQGTPTTWCSRMLAVAKKDGKPRRTVDYQKLNKATLRETHHTPSPFNLASSVPGNTKKTCFDAWNGYHSLPLTEKAKNAFTFITEIGRFRPLTAPQGYHASGDAYTRRSDDITAGFPRKTKCIDDTLLHDSSIETAFYHCLDYIVLCHENGIIFNKEKFHFAKDDVDFAGFTITKDGIKPTKRMITAIENFPVPRNVTDLRSFFGLINQVSYIFSESGKLEPFRELLKKGTKWYWDGALNGLFEDAKKVIVNQVIEGIKNFEVNRPCCLWTDWSQEGVGFSLFQKHCDCAMSPTCCKTGWKLILAKSRFTTSTEKRYHPIEGEASALVYALTKSRMFILGCPTVIVACDHKPLMKIFGDKLLEKIENPRLFALKEKSLMYNFDVVYVEGARNKAADAFSRHPVDDTDTSSVLGSKLIYNYIRSGIDDDDKIAPIEIDDQIEATVVSALTFHSPDGGNVQAIPFQRVNVESSTDESISELIDYIVGGFPVKKDELPEKLQGYWNVRHDLSVLDNVVLYKHRIIIPSKLRRELLEILHAAHQGTTGMKARASKSVFWPGLNRDIDNTRAQCRDCNKIAPSQSKEPMIVTSALYPFDKVVADYFTLKGVKYLLYADRYSGWISVVRIKPTEGNSKFLKGFLNNLFAVYGVPNELSTDGGPPFDSYDFKSFLTSWGVHFRKSSAHYPQSNGRAELGVKAAKRMLLGNCDDNGDIDNDLIARSLLQYRNTPLQGINLSPAQILYGRNLKDCMPSLKEAMTVREEWRIAADEREKALRTRHVKNIEAYNEHSKDLPELSTQDNVAVQNQDGNHPNRWDRTGKVIERLPFRQYKVKMDGSNRVTLRNRKFLRKIDPICAESSLPSLKIPTPSGREVEHQEEPQNSTRNVVVPEPEVREFTPASDGLRRSTRERAPRQVFEASHGKSHGYKNVNDT